jgi:hypothetical protein
MFCLTPHGGMSARPSVRDSRLDLKSSAPHSLESKNSPVISVQRYMAVNRSSECYKVKHDIERLLFDLRAFKYV